MGILSECTKGGVMFAIKKINSVFLNNNSSQNID